jgi:DNA adenine methylase
MTKPPLKWVGGKAKLLPQLKPLMPEKFGRYIEPFFGGGAMFFDLKPRFALLADANIGLVMFYQVLRDQLDTLIYEASALERGHSPEQYYEARTRWNRGEFETKAEQAATFLYLNRTCFNGLWRENKKGEMNSPIGAQKGNVVVDVECLRAASHALWGVTVGAYDFTNTLSTAEPGDFVYLDPPYWLTSVNGQGHVSYTKEGFSALDQNRLAHALVVLNARGVKFMLSNSDTPFTRALYHGWDVRTVLAGRSINSDTTKRGAVSELVVRNY